MAFHCPESGFECSSSSATKVQGIGRQRQFHQRLALVPRQTDFLRDGFVQVRPRHRHRPQPPSSQPIFQL
jgi:hypothetical protein